jgi:hypothetical protein
MNAVYFFIAGVAVGSVFWLVASARVALRRDESRYEGRGFDPAVGVGVLRAVTSRKDYPGNPRP